MMKTIAFFGSALLLVVACGVPAASAGLIAEPPNNDVILDTITGYTWLAAPVTLGQSPNGAVANNPGYQLATLSQVEMLLVDAGIPSADFNTGNYYGSDSAAMNSFSQLFQLTDVWVQYYGAGASGWEYQGFGNILSSNGTSWDVEETDVRNPPTSPDGASSSLIGEGNCFDCSASDDFNFLVNTGGVSNTPEPATWSLAGFSLLAAGLWRRNRA